MTVAALHRDRRWLVPAIVAAGCIAIAYRPASYGSTLTFLFVGAAGMLAFPVVRTQGSSAAMWVAVTAIGVSAFWAGRAMGAPIGVRYTSIGVVILVFAAICEEAFFRRFLYGVIAVRNGDVAALVVSSVLFALVHVPMYGWRALPIDLAAGLMLGWQRTATGGWTSPAVAHIAANLMLMG